MPAPLEILHVQIQEKAYPGTPLAPPQEDPTADKKMLFKLMVVIISKPKALGRNES